MVAARPVSDQGKPCKDTPDGTVRPFEQGRYRPNRTARAQGLEPVRTVWPVRASESTCPFPSILTERTAQIYGWGRVNRSDEFRRINGGCHYYIHPWTAAPASPTNTVALGVSLLPTPLAVCSPDLATKAASVMQVPSSE